MVLNLAIIIYFVNLIRFHTMLSALNMTTYRYLKLKEGDEMRKSKVVLRKSEKAVERAQDENDNNLELQASRLRTQEANFQLRKKLG